MREECDSGRREGESRMRKKGDRVRGETVRKGEGQREEMESTMREERESRGRGRQ